MAKENSGSPKIHQLESNRNRLSWILGVSTLCVVFYILGAWQNSSSLFAIQRTENCNADSATNSLDTSRTSLALDFETHHQVASNQPLTSSKIFPPCHMNYSEYTPCQDPDRSKKFKRERLIYRERHCPSKEDLLMCLIPAPPNYKNPFKWPQSRDYAWYDNVPHKELTIEKAVQNWIQVEGDKFRFPGGGTMFPRGANAYIDDIGELIPLSSGSIRTALDTGCGVASWGAYLLNRDILTMSFAPRDTHEAQVQFALERGVPAMIGVMAADRMPYPARSFDMAHCSRCLIPWADYGGLFLIEVDRVLRPGGYWILSGPPIRWKKYYKGWERTQEDLKSEQDSIEDVAKRICWKKVVEKDDLAVWQKPLNHMECVNNRKVFKVPHIFKWPQSRDYAWYDNVPHKELTIEKAVQNWIQVEGDKFRFPGGGTMFPRGAIAYIDDIGELIPLSSGSIRTALDTGCGVASWGAYLLNRDILTMSFAPRDTHEAQVQFALERGVPAMIGVMAADRMPYPARSFDMAHCSRCLIPWADYGGLFLIEVDRVLRPGGYWILSGPPIRWKKYYKGWERTQEDLKSEQDSIEDVAKRICWKKVVEKDDLAVWQKPLNHMECVNNRKVFKVPHICKEDNPDAAWYKKMETCITPLPQVQSKDEVAGGAVKQWPHRAMDIPPRIASGSIPGITSEKFRGDNDMWKDRLAHYKTIISSLTKGRYRNIMDMNAYLGGFAAALADAPVWVMNVVPADSKHDTLGVIYERGFIGTYQDWCEAFSTYPRTYDLLHAPGVFSIYQDRCDITNILLEMDRILRPEGTIIFRDTVDVLVKIQAITEGMRWKSQIVDHESGPFHPEKILYAVKTYWTGKNS